MDELENAFREGLRRVDTLDPPVRPIDPAEVVARAGRGHRWPGGGAARVLLAVASVTVVALVIWTGWSRMSVPAVPAPVATPSATPDATGWVLVSPSLLSPRWGAVGAWVDGRYLVVGGRDGVPCPANADCVDHWDRLTDGALYDPAANAWTPIAPVPTTRGVTLGAVVLGSSVYMLEDWSGKKPRDLLRYDLATDAWQTYRVPQPAGESLVATDRAIVVLSGSDEFGAVPDRVFDPKDAAWSTLPSDPLGPSFNRGAIWLGDRLLLTGHGLGANPGATKPSLLRLAMLDGTLATWRKLPDSPILGGGGVHYIAGRVVWSSVDSADGGQVGNWGRPYPFGGIYDPATGAWSDLPPSRGRGGLGGATVDTGRLVAVAGNLLDPLSLAWTPVPAFPGDERSDTTVVGGADSVLFWGGGDLRASYADGFLLRV